MPNKIQIAGLEFEDIKSNLKEYLRSQSTFRDYDFNGSALNILIELLAFNTYYNSYYLNMVANEMTLDTAVLRDSILAHAKSLNYVPSSRRAAEAIVDILVTPPGGNTQSSLTLNRFTEFQSEAIDGVNYSFVVPDSVTVYKENGAFLFEDVSLLQGNPQSLTFIYDTSVQSIPEFELPHDNVDTDTLQVIVQESDVNTSTQIFTNSTDVTSNVSGAVYFLSPTVDNKYKLVFGDGRVTQSLSNGNIIQVTYLTTDGDAANKANAFATGAIGGFSNVSVSPISAASGGSERESDASIKFNAPLFNASQNRAVTPRDYSALLLRHYPAIRSVSVWGGEDNDPPVFDSVFISYLTRNGIILNETEKTRIIDEILTPLSLITVTPVFVDPEYTYLKFNTSVKIDQKATSLTFDQVEELVRTAIVSYVTNNLNAFDVIFASSKLEKAIDDTLSAIAGSDTVTKVEKRLTPTTNTSVTYTINFNMPLKRSTVTSGLQSTGFYTYDSLNIRRLAYIEEVFDSFTGIDEIQITNPGFGYTEAPTVTITGDGTGATAVATILNGQVDSITLTNRGSGYTTASVSFSGGGGLEAAASTVVTARYGTLRLYYSKSNAEKESIESRIGTINYETGEIVLHNLNVESVPASDGKIRFTIEPESALIKTLRNQLLTVDSEDTTAIAVTVQSV